MIALSCRLSQGVIHTRRLTLKSFRHLGMKPNEKAPWRRRDCLFTLHTQRTTRTPTHEGLSFVAPSFDATVVWLDSHNRLLAEILVIHGYVNLIGVVVFLSHGLVFSDLCSTSCIPSSRLIRYQLPFVQYPIANSRFR